MVYGCDVVLFYKERAFCVFYSFFFLWNIQRNDHETVHSKLNKQLITLDFKR